MGRGTREDNCVLKPEARCRAATCRTCWLLSRDSNTCVDKSAGMENRCSRAIEQFASGCGGACSMTEQALTVSGSFRNCKENSGMLSSQGGILSNERLRNAPPPAATSIIKGCRRICPVCIVSNQLPQSNYTHFGALIYYIHSDDGVQLLQPRRQH